MSSSLAGKVALVTGASRGIGRSIALTLAQAGADVAVCSQSGKLDEVTKAITALGRRVHAEAADVGDAAHCERLVRNTERVLGRIDLLVNNAGIALRKSMAEMSDEDFDRTLRVNLSSAFYLSRRALASLRANRGRIVNVSSISATMGTPRLTAYCASKWGVNGLTKALAEELKPEGIFVAAVLPGSVDTDMLEGSGFAPAMGPDEVANVVRYLCAEAPFAMTGSLVEVFG
jgi:3-oxoacyl-[acyl-carrier protein] reductase